LADLSTGTLVSLPFPYAETLKEKTRPALILSVLEDGFPYTLLWVAMITSSKGKPWPGDISISITDLDGTEIPCAIRPAKLATAVPERVSRVLGRVDDDVFKTCRVWLSGRLADGAA